MSTQKDNVRPPNPANPGGRPAGQGEKPQQTPRDPNTNPPPEVNPPHRETEVTPPRATPGEQSGGGGGRTIPARGTETIPVQPQPDVSTGQITD